MEDEILTLRQQVAVLGAENDRLRESIQRLLERYGSPGRCRACKEPIFFIRTRNDRWTPVGIDGIPHWAVCTDPERFRKEIAHGIKAAGTNTNRPA